MRRNRPKWSKFVPIAAMVALIAAFALIGALSKRQAAPLPAPEIATPPLLAVAAPTATATAVIVVGVPNKLTIVRGTSLMFYPCALYRVIYGSDIVAAGDTFAGPVVDITGKVVTLECDTETITLR